MQTENLKTPRTPQGDAPSTQALTPNEPAKPNNRPWVVVAGAGTDYQTVWSECRSHSEALKELNCWNAAAGLMLDVMKRREDGTLTTEF